MTTPSRYQGIKGDECQCGRRASVRHCPQCGSVRTYARQNRLHKLADGTEKWVQTQFRCQACGHLFIDEEREFCEAPPVGPVLAAQKVRALHEASKTGEYLRPEERVAAEAIQEMLGPQPNSLLSDTQLRNLHTALRREWVDARMRAQQSGQPFTELCEDYVQRSLRESGREALIPEIYRVEAALKELADKHASLNNNGE